jgi:GGDEF domain-containing protein
MFEGTSLGIVFAGLLLSIYGLAYSSEYLARLRKREFYRYASEKEKRGLSFFAMGRFQAEIAAWRIEHGKDDLRSTVRLLFGGVISDVLPQLPTVASAVMLFLAAYGRYPYAFYTVLRIVVTLTALYLALKAHVLEKSVWIGLMLAIAIVFNPIFPIYLSRSQWHTPDLIVAAIFAITIWFIQGPENEDQNRSESTPSPPPEVLVEPAQQFEEPSPDETTERIPPRILLVNDSPSEAFEACERILRSHGYEVRSTNNAVQAIEMARDLKPNVAMLRLITPDSDGFGLGTKLSGSLSHTKVVLFDEVDVVEVLESLKQDGYRFDVLTLPQQVQEEELLEKTKRWVFEAATKDLVTGFGLQAHLDFILDTEIVRNRIFGHEFSMVLIEVTERWFKPVATELSWRSRKLISEIGARVRSTCRLVDLCFRTGERGFAVLLPQGRRETAQVLTDELRLLFSRADWQEIMSVPVEIDAKFAVVSFPHDSQTKGGLIAIARRTLE